jgi:hypothetical protein
MTILRAEDYISTLLPLPEPYVWMLPRRTNKDEDHSDLARQRLLYVGRSDFAAPSQHYAGWRYPIIAWYSGDPPSDFQKRNRRISYNSLYYGRKAMGEAFESEIHNLSFKEAQQMIQTLACLGEL